MKSLYIEWKKENVIEIEWDVFTTQDSNYKNRLRGKKELKKYYKKEFGIVK